jgi:hypothetical protein
MKDYRLPKTPRNEVYDRAVEIGLDPATFQWHEETSNYRNKIHRIVHGPTGAFLKIDYVVQQPVENVDLMAAPPKNLEVLVSGAVRVIQRLGSSVNSVFRQHRHPLISPIVARCGNPG